MNGLGGKDTIRSLGGNGTVKGGAGNERIEGELGDDRMLGDAGREVMIGGFGGDSFVFGTGDRVTGFSAAQVDEILFLASRGLDFGDIAVSSDRTGATIYVGGQTMRLEGATQPFDLGNHIKFDDQTSFDFL